MLAGRRPQIFGDGTQSRDFTFVEDVVQANLLAAEVPGIGGNLYNVACGDRISLLELMDCINALLGTDIAPVLNDPRPGDVKHSLADIQRARTDLGYEPKVPVREGVRRCLKYFQEGRGQETPTRKKEVRVR
jgi:UDP-glucose 4-epimerase